MLLNCVELVWNNRDTINPKCMIQLIADFSLYFRPHTFQSSICFSSPPTSLSSLIFLTFLTASPSPFNHFPFKSNLIPWVIYLQRGYPSADPIEQKGPRNVDEMGNNYTRDNSKHAWEFSQISSNEASSESAVYLFHTPIRYLFVSSHIHRSPIVSLSHAIQAVEYVAIKQKRKDCPKDQNHSTLSISLFRTLSLGEFSWGKHIEPSIIKRRKEMRLRRRKVLLMMCWFGDTMARAIISHWWEEGKKIQKRSKPYSPILSFGVVSRVIYRRRWGDTQWILGSQQVNKWKRDSMR